jgi:hypothetical protein
MEQRAIVHIAGEMRCRKTAQNKPVFGRIRHRGPATEATIADRPLYASSARTERRSQRSHPTSRLSEEKEAVVVFRENPGTLVQNSKSHRCDVCTRLYTTKMIIANEASHATFACAIFCVDNGRKLRNPGLNAVSNMLRLLRIELELQERPAFLKPEIRES